MCMHGRDYSVASESVFSASGNFAHARRNKLTVEIVEMSRFLAKCAHLNVGREDLHLVKWTACGDSMEWAADRQEKASIDLGETGTGEEMKESST
jgi:hypothetical protein